MKLNKKVCEACISKDFCKDPSKGNAYHWCTMKCECGCLMGIEVQGNNLCKQCLAAAIAKVSRTSGNEVVRDSIASESAEAKEFFDLVLGTIGKEKKMKKKEKCDGSCKNCPGCRKVKGK
ncbi:MAG: hypothetical protein WCF94_04095 [bacterium]